MRPQSWSRTKLRWCQAHVSIRFSSRSCSRQPTLWTYRSLQGSTGNAIPCAASRLCQASTPPVRLRPWAQSALRSFRLVTLSCCASALRSPAQRMQPSALREHLQSFAHALRRRSANYLPTCSFRMLLGCRLQVCPLTRPSSQEKHSPPRARLWATSRKGPRCLYLAGTVGRGTSPYSWRAMQAPRSSPQPPPASWTSVDSSGPIASWTGGSRIGRGSFGARTSTSSSIALVGLPLPRRWARLSRS
mmetsp:Transcript_5081/g.14873  ORF Transcript_5081/g.14873 Transcript_5081/m.14873 type:complete len:246 (-) Transcript_5081:480-1217(-)